MSMFDLLLPARQHRDRKPGASATPDAGRLPIPAARAAAAGTPAILQPRGADRRVQAQPRPPGAERRQGPRRRTAPPSGSSVLSLPSVDPVIAAYADFPKWEDVCSGHTASGGFHVPVDRQDLVMAIKLSASRVALCYDPAHLPVVKDYFAPMRNETTVRGWVMEPTMVRVQSKVLAMVRQAAQSKHTRSGPDSGTGSKTSAAEILREWVSTAHALRATDMHLRILDGGRGEVLVRVDGELEPLEQSRAGLSSRDVQMIMETAYAMADRHSNNLGTFSDSKSLACMIDSKLHIPNLRLRFGSQRGFFGPKAVLRLLPTEIDAAPLSFADMGFAPSQIELLESVQRTSRGIFLQCGVTGSGKTTAAKTFIETHPRNGCAAFYQVADPIEYLLRGTHQIYVQRDLLTLHDPGKKSPYAEVMESLLRMDPDYVDGGEIRDAVSARGVISVAKSGHFAMGTLHTDSVAGIVNRLCDPSLGLSRSELTAGSILAALSYQALLPKLCPHCALDTQAACQQLHTLGRADQAQHIARVVHTLEHHFGIAGVPLRFKNVEGCAQCRQRGTKGLTIAAEMMRPDDEWLDLTGEGKDRAAWRHYREAYSNLDLTSPNMHGKTVLEHALYKAIHGWIDPRQLEVFGPLHLYDVLGKGVLQ